MKISIIRPLATQTRLPVRRLAAIGHQVTTRMADAASHSPHVAGLADVLIIETRGRNTREAAWIRELRRSGSRIVIVVAGSRIPSDGRIAFLDSGADDVVALPIAVEELMARIHAIQRRTGSSSPVILNFADVQLDRLTRRASRSGRDLSLTSRGFQILECFMMRPRQILTRADLEREVWSSDSDLGQRVAATSNLIDVHLMRLRRKVDRPFSTELIRTVRGRGFVLSDEPTPPTPSAPPMRSGREFVNGSSPLESRHLHPRPTSVR